MAILPKASRPFLSKEIMSGILGVWNLDGRPVERELLDKMAATMAHRGPDGCFVWSDGSIGLACQQLKVSPESLNETQPLVGSTGAVLVWDGRLDNREEILADLPDRTIPANAPDPELVLAAYEAYGDSFPERLNGDFELAVFDPRRQQLLLTRDALGVRPLYYYQAGRSLLFASECKAFLPHPHRPQKPNEDALAWYLMKRDGLDTMGFTFFEGVVSVLPGRMAIATPERVVTKRYWDFDRWRRISLKSFEEYGEAFRHVFEQAVRRRLRSRHPVAVSLSGGLDSSAIFCAAEQMRQKDASIPKVFGVNSVYEGGTTADEQFFISEIEREYGVRVVRAPAPLEFIEGHSESVWHTETPLLTELTTCITELFGGIRGGGARSMLSGLWGDQVLFDQAYLVTLFRKLKWLEIHRHLKSYTDWYPDVSVNHYRRTFARDVLRAHIPDALRPTLRRVRRKLTRPGPHERFYTESFKERYRKFPFEEPENDGFASSHARSLYYVIRSGYYVSCLEIDNKIGDRFGVEVSFPFLDRDVVAFLMAIPGEMQNWKGIPKAILREAMKGTLPQAIGLRRGKADCTYFCNQAMSAARPRILRTLGSDALSIRGGYVKPEVEEVLKRFKDPAEEADSMASWDLADLFGLELWLQVFFGNQASEGN